jgi:hypothetical protein
VRAHIKRDCKDVSVVEVDRALRVHAGEGSSDEASAAEHLVRAIRASGVLFHDPDGVAYIAFDCDDHRETWPLDSRGFREWAARFAYAELNLPVREQTLRDVMLTLSGIAKFEGECHPVHLRVARFGGGYLLDLCNDRWQAVHVTATGWRVLDNSPLHFIRREAMRPLPLPQRDGDLGGLWPLLNICPADRNLLLAWLLETLRADTPYPVLEFCGEQGSAKSTTQEYLRRLIDPNKSNLRSAPKDREAVFVAARNGHVVSFENISHLSPDMQDALCVLATGGGFATRRFYSNEDESIIEVCRPVMLNGISAAATAQDLVDRTLHFDLEPVTERRTEAELEAAFEATAAGILGALLDLFARALAELPHIRLLALPRMADFALFGAAVYRAVGRTEAAFLADYTASRRESILRTLDGSPVAVAIQSFLTVRPAGIVAPVKEIMEAVSVHKPQGEAWPKSPKGFADAMRRAATALRTIGIEVKRESGASRREGIVWAIRPVPEDASACDRPEKQPFSPRTPEMAQKVHQVHDVHGDPRIDAAEVII